MSKSNRLKWFNGEILTAEQLYEMGSDLENYVFSVIKYTHPDFHGIIDFQYDLSKLQEGYLNIIRLQAIFPNGEYVNYNNESYDLSIKIDGSVVYLYVGQEFSQEINYINTNINQVIIRKSAPMLKLSHNKTNNSIKLLLSIGTKSSINPSSILSLRGNNKIDKMIILLKNQMKFYGDKKDIMKMIEYKHIMGLLINLKGTDQPRKFYEILVLIAAILELTDIGPYEHSNNYMQIDQLLTKIEDILSIDLKECTVEENNHILTVSIDNQMEYIYIISDKSNENTLMNSNIGCENIDNLIINQDIGLDRQVSYHNNSVWIKVFIPIEHQNKLYIYLGTNIDCKIVYHNRSDESS